MMTKSKYYIESETNKHLGRDENKQSVWGDRHQVLRNGGQYNTIIAEFYTLEDAQAMIEALSRAINLRP